MSRPTSTGIRERILDEMRRSGFLLEIEVGSKFSSQGWSVGHQGIFRDSDERKVKYIDLTASKLEVREFGRFGRFNISVVCECKKSEKPWVFYTPPNNALTHDPDLLSLRYVKLVSFPSFEARDYPVIQPTHYVSREPLNRLGQANYLSFGREDRPGEGFNQINSAINQVLKATKFQMDSFSPLLARMGPILQPNLRALTFFYPLIVLEGPMYEYNLRSDGEPNLQEVSYVKYQACILGDVTASSEQEAGEIPQVAFLIDIVKKELLGEYISYLEEEIRQVTSTPILS